MRPSAFFIKDCITPPEAVTEAVPYSRETLEDLLISNPKNSPALKALAYLAFQDGDYNDAIDYSEKARALSPLDANSICTLAAAHFLLGNMEEAGRLLKSGIETFPFSSQLHYFLGSLYRQEDKLGSALSQFESLLSNLPDHTLALLSVAEIYEIQGFRERALETYKTALRNSPDNTFAKNRVAFILFNEVEKLFTLKDYAAAFKKMWELHSEYAPAFIADQDLAKAIADLSQSFTRSWDKDEAVKEFLKHRGESEDNSQIAFKFFSEYFYSLGLFPEHYIPLELLGPEAEHQTHSLALLGEHPFPRFRLGLAAALRGNLTKSLEEFSLCEERLPPKKQRSLKLPIILPFMRALVRQLDDGESAVAEDDITWEEAGFDNLFEKNSWEKVGFKPADAKEWKTCGFSPVEARLWKNQKILKPKEAKPWHDAGILDAKAAAKWIRSGLTPSQAAVWQADFPYEVELAIQCNALGFSDPKETVKWLKVFQFPGEAIPWLEQGFSPFEAESWVMVGVKDPYVAKRKKSQGLRPETAFHPVEEVREVDQSINKNGSNATKPE